MRLFRKQPKSALWLAGILAGIAALLMADYLVRGYQAERGRLENLCTYPFANRCDCAAGDSTCHAQCDAYRARSSEACFKDLTFTFYKLNDAYTWKFVLLLPVSFAGAGLLVLLLTRRRMRRKP